MHLFFDTVWKLHIGEIPEKCSITCHKGKIDECHNEDCALYNETIAAIKQNALIVGNPEIIKKEVSIREWYHDNQPVPDRSYFWPGGYKVKEEFYMTNPPRPTGYKIAILTLPEEKKNTMENMTKEQQREEFSRHHKAIEKIILDCRGVQSRQAAYMTKELEKFSLYKNHPTTASGSVAAPKEKTNIEDQFKIDNYKTVENRLLSANSDIKQLESENTALREALKELLPIAERKLNGVSGHREYIAFKAIIDTARKLILK